MKTENDRILDEFNATNVVKKHFDFDQLVRQRKRANYDLFTNAIDLLFVGQSFRDIGNFDCYGMTYHEIFWLIDSHFSFSVRPMGTDGIELTDIVAPNDLEVFQKVLLNLLIIADLLKVRIEVTMSPDRFITFNENCLLQMGFRRLGRTTTFISTSEESSDIDLAA